MLFSFLLVLALGVVAPNDGASPLALKQGGCPLFWFDFNGRCYKYVASQMVWADAERHCVSQRANLVSIHNLDEHRFVELLLDNFDHAHGLAWIGLSDAQKEGTWLWSDGSSADFFWWLRGQPNNRNGREHCVHYTSDKRWNDVPCSSRYAAVCVSRINC